MASTGPVLSDASEIRHHVQSVQGPCEFLTNHADRSGDEKSVVIPVGNMLHRTISSRSKASTWMDPGPPPDGGLQAWTQAVMAHFVMFNTWGYISSFGVFQTYYVTALGHSPSEISWVGSIQIFLLFFIGAFSGRALDAGFFRYVFVTGVIVQLIGVFMTSLATEYWQLLLAQGICTGLGNGLQFTPTVALVSTYFSKRKALALALGASGTATGGIVFPILVQQLLPKIGFAWTVRVVGFVMLAFGILTATVLRPRLPPRRSGPLVEWAAFKEIPFVLFCLGMFLNFWAMYFGFYYIGAFGRNIIGISFQESINLLVIMNGVGMVGRLIPAYLADLKFGPLNVITPLAFACAILMYSWSAVNSRAGVYAWACMYGLFSAGMQGLLPATLSSLSWDLKKAGVRIGMGFTILSLASLTGSPLGGALIQKDHGQYLYAQMWAGTTMLFGGCTLVAARIAKTGLVFRARA